ncbi:MAG: polysaccharide deacetylase family protein [Labilithrix sp.]
MMALAEAATRSPFGDHPAGALTPDGEAILQTLVDDGHVIGNHTWTHPDLTTLSPETIISEIAKTDALIAPFVSDRRFMFRPPYGAWNEQVFAALEGSPMSKYVGPIDWDLGFQWGPGMAADWDCWSKTGVSDPPVVDVVTCGNLYLEDIRKVASGVVLMHDPYFINDDPKQGGTVDMVKSILPTLKSEGFSFVRIDEVPAVSAALPPLTVPVVDAGVVDSSDVAPGETSAGSVSADSGVAPGASTATTDLPSKPPSGGSSDPCTASPQAASAKR